MRELEYLLYGIIDIYEFNNDGIKIVQEKNLEVKFQDMKSFDINNKYVFISLKNKDILIINIMNKTYKEKELIKNILKDNIKYIPFYNIKWTFVSILIIISITSFYGVKIYNSAINYNGRLAWFLEDLRMRKTVNNIEVKNLQEDREETYKENAPQLENKEAQEFHLSSKDTYALGVVGQGSNGDYNGVCKALYESKDEGKTWKYVKEVPLNQLNKYN